MALKINIILVLFLGVAPSWDQNISYLANPTDVDYQNITCRSEPNLCGALLIKNIHEAMLSKPYEYKNLREHQRHLIFLTSGLYRKANGQKYELDAAQQKKNHRSETKRQYVWYIEDRLWLDRKTRCVKQDAEAYTDTQHNRRPRIHSRYPHFLIQDLNFSIRMVADHYWIVSGLR